MDIRDKTNAMYATVQPMYATVQHLQELGEDSQKGW